MKTIELTQGLEAIIDDEWFYMVSSINWIAHNFRVRPYARSSFGCLMHRIIIDAQPGELVDHINGNTLDNRVSNLRKATPSQNNYNSKGRSKNKYKGVDSRNGRHYAYIIHNYKKINLGSFGSMEDAAKAYDDAAKELFGVYARTNF